MSNRRASARDEAAHAIPRVLDGAESIEAAVNRLRARLSARDLRLFRELLSGCVRWLRFLDSVVERSASRPLDSMDSEVLNHLRVAVYQILFLDRVPARAAVHEAVDLVKRSAGDGAGKFVNAVLRAVARHPDLEPWQLATGDRVADLAVNQSHPEALIRGWVKNLGWDRTVATVAASNRPRSVLGVMSGDRERLAANLRSAGAEVTASEVSPLGLLVSGLDAAEIVRAGGYIQDPASQAAALVPWPDPGERILDAAAAPGGKSLALHAADPTVRILAADLRLDRLSRLRANLVGHTGADIQLAIADALQPPFRPGFDRVLFDAPCSGTGTLRKHPELKWRINRDEIRRLVAMQLAGLQALAPLVGQGGRLCYLTCSIEPEENQGVVAAFLGSHPGWRLDTSRLAHGLDRWCVAAGKGWQMLPGDDHDGATVHVLVRSHPPSP